MRSESYEALKKYSYLQGSFMVNSVDSLIL